MVKRNEESLLSIIIPAYKPYFLDQTLLSLSKQSNKNFTIYIGDDHSPYDLLEIISPYMNQIDIVYHRFDENMGGESLTKQWERCISLSSEEWIWLFSDDDIASPNAVELFYQSLDATNLLYKFNTKIINENGDILEASRRYDPINELQGFLSSEDYIKQRLDSAGFRSYAVEYIFNRSLFETHGIVDFPAAWSSDDATWLLYSLHNAGKIKILNDYIYWRSSGKNISSNNEDLKIVRQKISASQLYIKWLIEITSTYKLQISKNLLLKWITCQLRKLLPSITWSTYKLRFTDLRSYFPILLLFRSYIILIKRQQLEHSIKSLFNK